MNIRLITILILSILLFQACVSHKEAMVGQQTAQSLQKEIVKQIRVQYFLYLPDNYNKTSANWPLLLFLHGAGERGNNINKVKVHGPPKLIANGRSFPFLVLSPQCPEGRWWSTETLNVLLNEIVNQYRVDRDRIYLTGLSMGGYGTWSMATEYPDRFAAIAPICGGGDPEKAERIKNLPIWVFHGAKDSVVPIEQSQRMVDALKELGSDVKFTVYPQAGHDAWTDTYHNKELYDWFLKHKR